VEASTPPAAAPAPPGLLLALAGAGCLGGFGWVRRRKPAAAAAVLVVAFLPDPVRAGFILSDINAGPYGNAQVDGFLYDSKNGYGFDTGSITSTVDGSSGDADDSAFYTATMSYNVPSSGSSLTVSGSWTIGTHLSTLTADVGGGLQFDSHLVLDAGQTFTITGTIDNSAVVFRDPDGHDVFPVAVNFSGTPAAISVSGTVATSGTYRLNFSSGIDAGGSPGSDISYAGGYDLTFTVGGAPVNSAPAPAGLLLGLTGAGCLAPLGWRRRKPAATA
jgi:hypothetical protein